MDNELRAISLSLQRSGRELDSLQNEVRQYGFWLGLEVPENVMAFGWNPLDTLKKASNYVKSLPKAVQTKVTTYVNNKVIAPVRKTYRAVKNTAIDYAKKGGNAVRGTINTLSTMKNKATTYVTKTLPAIYNKYIKTPLGAKKDQLKDMYNAGKKRAGALAKTVVDGLSKLKSDLAVRIKQNIGKYITTGQNLLASAKKKMTSANDKLAKARALIIKAKLARKMGFEEQSEPCKNQMQYIQEARKLIAEARGDAMAGQGDAKGSEAAVKDLETKAKAEVTVEPSFIGKVAPYILGTIAAALVLFGSPIAAVIGGAYLLYKVYDTFFGAAKTLEDDLGANYKAYLEQCTLKKEAEKKSNELSVAYTQMEAEYNKALADGDTALAAKDKEAMDAIAAEKFATAREIQAAKDNEKRLLQEQADLQQKAVDAGVTQKGMYDALDKVSPPEYKAPYVPIEQEKYQALAASAGLGMAVQDTLSTAENPADINAVGDAVKAAEEAPIPEGEGAPSKLPYIAAGLAIIGGGYYLLTKKKGGSYARA